MKKNIYYILAFSTVVLSMAACSKEQGIRIETSAQVTESLSAVKGDETTKISMNGRTLAFGWIPGVDNASFTIYEGGEYTFVDSDCYGDTEANKFTVSYSGNRQGYAVTPAIFKGSYDGNELHVNYPAAYDISARVDCGHYDDCYPSDLAYIQFPMVAESNSGNNELVFHSIGALVKVVVNQVPRGTKKLYVRFNKRVTGDFTVQNLETTTPYVEAEDGSSVIEYTISSTGVGKTTDIVLYIPVPTASGLSISASSATKANVRRNMGYEFDVMAISRVSTDTDFSLGGVNYILAQGNLYAYNNSGEIEYHLRSAADQVVTTLGAWHNDPHKNSAKLSSISTPGTYRDMFTWNELYLLFNGSKPSGAAVDVIDGKLTVDGTVWTMMSQSMMKDILSGSKIRDKRNTIEVGNLVGVVSAAAEIDLLNSPLFYYYHFKSSMTGNLAVYGRFLFPDGYVDMTDILMNSATTDVLTDANTKQVVSVESSTYEQMVAAGAIFLINGGYANESAVCAKIGLSNLAYVFGTSSADGKCDGLKIAAAAFATYPTTCSRDYYRSVRLCREGKAPDTENTSTVPGYDNKPMIDW